VVRKMDSPTGGATVSNTKWTAVYTVIHSKYYLTCRFTLATKAPDMYIIWLEFERIHSRVSQELPPPANCASKFVTFGRSCCTNSFTKVNQSSVAARAS